MTGLHLVHLPLDMARFNRWAGARDPAWAEWRNRRGRKLVAFDEGRALHHLLAETFGKGALQPFRIMVAPHGRAASVYAYGSINADELLRTARESAMPESLDVLALERLAVKSMPEMWKEGRRLAFDVRARPVRRLLRPAGGFGKGAELDAFLVEALRQYPDGPPQGEDEQIRREEVYADWLKERLEGAASLKEARLVRFSRRLAARESRATEGPDATIHGELVVESPEKFLALLARGVGRHAAYGYGMLLLRPIGRN